MIPHETVASIRVASVPISPDVQLFSELTHG